MKPKTYRTGLLVLGASLLSTSAWAATITVAPSGANFTSIQAAVDAAASNDTIEIAAGTYLLTETLTLGDRTAPYEAKKLHLKGAGKGLTIIKGAGTVESFGGYTPEMPLVTVEWRPSHNDAIPAAYGVSLNSGTSLEDLTLAGWEQPGGGNGYLLWSGGVQDVKLKNVGFLSNHNRVAIYADNGDGLNVDNCDFEGTFYRWAFRGAGRRLAFTNNNFNISIPTSGGIIALEYGRSTNALIEGNKFRHTVTGSAYLHGANDHRTIWNTNPLNATDGTQALTIKNNSFQFIVEGPNASGRYPVPVAIQNLRGSFNLSQDPGSPTIITGNSFSGYDYADSQAGNPALITTHINSTVTGNAFTARTKSSVIQTGTGTPALDATGNFWGTSAGAGVNDTTGSVDTGSQLAALPPTITGPVTIEGKSGSYLTITSAIEAAQPNDTILLAEGVYQEAVNLNKDGLTLKPASSAGSKPKILINGTTGALGTVVIAPGADNVTVEGLEIVGIDGPMGLEKAAVYLQGAHNGFTLRGNTVTAKGDSAILTEYGLVNSNIVIDGNLINGVTFNTSVATGVVTAGFDQWTVANVPRVLVYTGSGNPPTHSNVTFTNNVVSAVSGDATNGNVQVALHTAGSTVSGNTFSGTTGAKAGCQLLRVTGSAAAVSGNTFSGTASIALQAGTTGVGAINTAATSSATGNLFTGTFTSKVVNASTSSLNATNNFWGDASKPESTADFAGNVQPLPYFKDAAFSQAAPVTIATAPAVGYATIQAGINAAVANDTVKVDAGTYNEAVTVNKDIDLVGSGAATTTISTSNNIISITSAGSGSSVKGLTATGGARGFNVTDASGVLLENVASTGNTSFGINFGGASSGITLRNSSFSNNTSSGIKVDSSSRVANLLVEGSAVDGNKFGLYSADGSVATYQANAQLNGITVRNSSFSNNTGKGLFIESMNNGLFEGLTITNSGTGADGANGSGFDINLKHAAYTNLTIRNSVISGCGINYSFGGGLLIKARNDGSYASNPATLGGTVLVEGVRVEGNGKAGNGAGIRIGDHPSNVSPSNVVIKDSTFSGNNNYAVLNLVASSTVTAIKNHWGAASGPVGATTNMAGPNVTYMPWYGTSTSATPPVLGQPRTGIVENTEIDDQQDAGDDLYVAPGKKITVTSTGGLTAEKIELAEGAEIVVEGGDLNIGEGSKISGSFTIFNSFGSWNVNGDTTFEVSQALALITDIHVAPGKTITVNGGGELILDGCVIDNNNPNATATGTYNIVVEDDGLLTLARSVVSDAVIDIDTETASVEENLKSKVYDNSFTASDIDASPDALVYHNLFDSATNSASNPAGLDEVDDWSNVTDAANLRNKFTLDFAVPADSSNTLDSKGNLFVRPTNPVVVEMNVASLGSNTIVNAEALLGFNSSHLTLAPSVVGVTAATGWEVVAERDISVAPFGLVDSTLGLKFDSETDPNGISADSTVGTIQFTAGAPGLTAGFFRVQTNRAFDPDSDRLVRDTRLTKFDGTTPTDLAAFTANTGELVIDGLAPVIHELTAEARQEQPSAPAPVDVFDPANRVFRNGATVELTFDATDNGHGLSGLDKDDAADDLVLFRNGVELTSGYTVGATEAGGVVTYTVTLTIDGNTPAGDYEISATVQDRSGNPSEETELGTYTIANEVLATVELQGFGGASRQVTFVATGGVTTETWTKTVAFTGSQGSVFLEDVPAGTTSISAKTAWTLRSKKDFAVLPFNGVGAISLTGTDKLLAGDINGDNVINTFDYTLLRFNFGSTTSTVGDINGDGGVSTGDYNLQRANFYQIGEGQ